MSRLEDDLRKIAGRLAAKVGTQGVYEKVTSRSGRSRFSNMRVPLLAASVVVGIALGFYALVSVFVRPERGQSPSALISSPVAPSSATGSGTGPVVSELTGKFVFAGLKKGSGTTSLYVMAAESDSFSKIVDGAGASGFSWSPDETRVAFTKGTAEGAGELLVVDGDGGGATMLANFESPQYPSWSPSGEEIAFTTGRGDLYIVGDDGGDLRQVIDSGDACLDLFPEWSPDASQLAFVRDCTENGAPGIYLVGADGMGLTRIYPSHNTVQGVTWSPDGLRLAFAEWPDQNQGIYTIGIDGADLLQLTDQADLFPAWSQAGSEIAFLRDGEVWAVSSSGGEAIQVTMLPDLSIKNFSWTLATD